MSRVLSSTTSMSQTEALHEMDFPKRTFERKRSIAELMIFDRPEFDKLVDELAKTSSRQRNIRQEKMTAECFKILERPALKIKRRHPIDKLCGNSQRISYKVIEGTWTHVKDRVLRRVGRRTPDSLDADLTNFMWLR